MDRTPHCYRLATQPLVAPPLYRCAERFVNARGRIRLHAGQDVGI